MAKFINTATTGVRQTFGKYTGTVAPGLRFYIPGVQTITPVSNRLTQDAFAFEVKTKDNVFARIGLAVQYRVQEDDTAKAFFSLENPAEQIDAYVENVVRAKVPKMKLDELFESQDDICKSVQNELSKKMKDHGFTIENTLVTEINPNSEVKDAMNKINASNRLKEAAKNEADANYIKKVREAEADRDRKRLDGEGISLQRTAIFNGYKDGVKDMAGDLEISTTAVTEFLLKMQHLDTIGSIGRSPNAKTLFVGHETDNKARDAMIQALDTMDDVQSTKFPSTYREVRDASYMFP